MKECSSSFIYIFTPHQCRIYVSGDPRCDSFGGSYHISKSFIEMHPNKLNVYRKHIKFANKEINCFFVLYFICIFNYYICNDVDNSSAFPDSHLTLKKMAAGCLHIKGEKTWTLSIPLAPSSLYVTKSTSKSLRIDAIIYSDLTFCACFKPIVLL